MGRKMEQWDGTTNVTVAVGRNIKNVMVNKILLSTSSWEA
jgi:hypothetical protein